MRGILLCFSIRPERLFQTLLLIAPLPVPDSILSASLINIFFCRRFRVEEEKLAPLSWDDMLRRPAQPEKNGARSVPLRSGFVGTIRQGKFKGALAGVAAAAWDKPRSNNLRGARIFHAVAIW